MLSAIENYQRSDHFSCRITEQHKGRFEDYRAAVLAPHGYFGGLSIELGRTNSHSMPKAIPVLIAEGLGHDQIERFSDGLRGRMAE